MPTTIKKTSLDMLMGTKNAPAKSAADAPTTAGLAADALAIDALATDAHNGEGAAVNDNYEGPLDSESGQPLHSGALFEEDGEDALPGVVDVEPADTEHRPSHDIELTEDFIAADFIDRYGHVHRYDHDDGHWRRWDDSRWKKDETRATFDGVRTFCRALRDCERSMSSRRAIDGVEGADDDPNRHAELLQPNLEANRLHAVVCIRPPSLTVSLAGTRSRNISTR